MADLTTACCPTVEQATCCEPSEKVACCDANAHGQACGCAAGRQQEPEIRETVRERYASAALAAA